MGLNPGGDPELVGGTVAAQATGVLLNMPANCSAYRDESWAANARPPGTWGMQPRVLHLLDRLGLDPGTVPASNLVFVRSRREADIPGEQMTMMAEACWPFHQAVIKRLGVRVIVCFGGTTATVVRLKTGALEEVDRFVEANNRRWTSRAFRSPDGSTVVQVTHPSIADWRSPQTDITPLVARALRTATN